MRRTTSSWVTGLVIFLLSSGMLSAAVVPLARSSTGPALAGFDDHLYLAWTGDSAAAAHRVWYSSFDGKWTHQAAIPGSSTSTAPALGVADQLLYLAATSPATSEIRIYVSSGGTFAPVGALCDALTTACAQTLAAPALVGDQATLFAAWTTTEGGIRYATHYEDEWHIAPQAIPNATTNLDTAPTVAVYGNRLYVAWTAPSGGTIRVASAAITSASLPPSVHAWSSNPARIAAQTAVAPALGVLIRGVSGKFRKRLYLAWTTTDSLAGSAPDSSIEFAEFDGAAGSWASTVPPVPLPPGPLTHFTPALDGSALEISGVFGDYDTVAYTDLEGNISPAIVHVQP